MNEAETRAEYIAPNLKTGGWGEIPREFAGFTMAEFKPLNGFRETVPAYV